MKKHLTADNVVYAGNLLARVAHARRDTIPSPTRDPLLARYREIVPQIMAITDRETLEAIARAKVARPAHKLITREEFQRLEAGLSIDPEPAPLPNPNMRIVYLQIIWLLERFPGAAFKDPELAEWRKKVFRDETA